MYIVPYLKLQNPCNLKTMILLLLLLFKQIVLNYLLCIQLYIEMYVIYFSISVVIE